MGKTLESDIILIKKTFLMIHALEQNSGMIKTAIDTARKDFAMGMKKIREYMQTNGIQNIAREEINNIIELADAKLSHLDIKKEKLLYFSEMIRKRGH